MAMTTYAELSTSVAGYLARTDLTDQIPDFISMAELRMQRELRIRQMLKSVTLTATSGSNLLALPSDFIQVRDLVVVGNPVTPLNFYAPSALSRNTRTAQSGKPLDYTLLAENFQLSPIPDSAYSLDLLYYAKPPVLSSSNASNIFMVTVPDMLLYATLLESEPYLMNDARVSTWVSLYERASISVTKSDETGQYSGVPLAIKVI
jgi:hypothetical protein